MPFGTKNVADRQIDFDAAYANIFVPAVGAARAPDGSSLYAKRADSDLYSANIDNEMYQYLERSRLMLADITGLNVNVVYELGVRHRARPSGTVLIRQEGEKLPFDIARIRVFTYAHEPPARILGAIEFLANLITNSIAADAVDSPPFVAMRLAVRDDPTIEKGMASAENALRMHDTNGAIEIYERLLAANPDNPAIRSDLGAKIALLYRDLDRWDDVAVFAQAAVDAAPENASAWRDVGIVQGRVWASAPDDAKPVETGEGALRNAVKLAPRDYDAWSSLGGVLRRDAVWQTNPGRREALLRESLAAYEKGSEVSGGHPYPLLNALKLRFELAGKVQLTDADQIALEKAAWIRQPQADANPPYDKPWSCFDMSDIALLRGTDDDFYRYLRRGAQFATKGESKSHLHTLRLLDSKMPDNAALSAGIALLFSLI